MKTLIITEKLDAADESSGLFHSALKDFGSDCSELTVLVLEKKSHTLPDSVRVLSLGKETNPSRFSYLGNFYRFIFRYAAHYDRVLVHRSPIYILLGGIFWKLMGKRVDLWYNHTFVDNTLKRALWFVDNVYSPSKESFPIQTRKLLIVRGYQELGERICK